MFPARMFAPRMFAPRYFPGGPTSTPTPPVVHLPPWLLWWWCDAGAGPGTGPLTFKVSVDATPPAGHFVEATVEEYL